MERIARIQSNRAHLTICHVKLNNAKPVWQAFEREGKGGLGGEGNARGARGGGGGKGNACQETIVFAIPPTNYVCKNNATVND